jgi:thermitase
MLIDETEPEGFSNSGRWLLAAGAVGVVLMVAAVWRMVLFPPDPAARDGEQVAGAAGDGGFELSGDGVTERRQRPRSERAGLLRVRRVTSLDLREALVGPGAVPGEALLTFRSAEDLRAFLARVGDYGMEVLHHDERLRAARVGWEDLDRLADAINANPNALENVAANLIARIPGLPEAPRLDEANQGGQAAFQGADVFSEIGAEGDRGRWGDGVKVAVLDSGIGDHETVQGAVLDRARIVEEEAAPHGHGTSMASLIGGRVEPAAGVAQGARLLDIQVADERGISNTALVATGIMEAVDRGAAVINVSLGSFGSSLMMQNAVQWALQQGVVIVAAAGNEQLDRLAFPAAYPGVISVGAVDADRRQAYFSNSGRSLTIAAPGIGIVSAYPDGQFVIGSGTSQAAALTSGVVATLLGRGHSAAEIPNLLKNAALPIDAPSEQVGAGMLRMPRGR